MLSVCANRPAAFSEDEISAMERFALDAARRLRPALRIADLDLAQSIIAAVPGQDAVSVHFEP
ncbi:hypothetical protein StoSoilB5_25750 [Arthrobacter sp. StoSoilB5]|nr:hypothetical protein StoSoilB5_25750 [Arthrobacter sp. StoSoilB5]